MKNKTKIIFLVSEFLPGPGGIGNQAYCLSKYLSQSDFELIIIAPNRVSFNSRSFDTQEKIRILRYLNSSFFKIFHIIYLLLTQYIRNKEAILLSSGQLPIIIIGFFSKLFNSKNIAISHGHETKMGNKIFKKLTTYAIKQYDQIIAVSQFSGNILKKKISKDRITIINNGVNINRFEKQNTIKRKNNNHLNLITLGSLSARKGQHNVINALPFLKKHFTKIKYHMVGPENIKNELLDLAISLKVDDLIQFHGYLDDLQLSKLFYSSDVFLMLSENLRNGDVEGFGIAILEANYFGLPAIGSKGCGIEDAIKNNETGVLVDSDSPRQIKIALEKILNNYTYFSNQSRAWAQNHDWSKVSKDYINLLNKLN